MIELSLTLRSDQQEAVEAALEDVGALAVTLLDADADTSNEQAILEPGVGETPLWSLIVLTALFEADIDRSGLLHVLGELLPDLEPAQIVFREVADQDWTRVWMDQFKPMRFGERLWIYPWNIEPPAESELVIVRLDPGLAFGTGTHPTTALCLEWLDQADLGDKTVIDYGCGSGVLAIAAALLGARKVIAIDNDPQAIEASHDNAERNGVAGSISLFLPDADPGATADVLVANILAGPLHALAPVFAARLGSGGALALSGILIGQRDELLERYSEWFDGLSATVRDDWVRIDGRRR
ncbi:MAG: 50S ribosomal protein L11 methyltransferase [Xanthomonadales bacterium]|nr:50S ribosomal protein L11 methyltransferase [Xanthomonadales bacterium]